MKKEQKLTIGLFNDTFFPMIDGVVSVVHNYANSLSKFANVIVFVPFFPGKKFDDSSLPYKVVRCKSIKIPYGDYPWPQPNLDHNFLKQLNSYKLDIVHIHSPFGLGKMGIKYAKKHNIPVIATMHSQFKQDFQRVVKLELFANLLTKSRIRIFNKCDECWAVNSEVANIFYKDYGYKQLPRVMNNASEMLPINDLKEVIKLRNKHHIEENERVFLFVGRLNKLKGVLFLIESLNILKTNNPNFKFKMIFVGTGQDETELKNLVKKYKMTKEVLFVGKITNRELLATYYKMADLFLFPSLYDASSIVQIEAASQKTPTVFVEGAATTATITNNKNGYIVENDPLTYANKILDIFNNKTKYENVCENAYKDLYINWDDKIKEVYKLYKQIINRKNR